MPQLCNISPSGDILYQDRPICNFEKLHFSTWWLWLMTLTFEPVWDIIMVNVLTNFPVHMSHRSTVRVLNNRQTDRQTHWTDFIPSTACTRGNKLLLTWLCITVPPFKSSYLSVIRTAICVTCTGSALFPSFIATLRPKSPFRQTTSLLPYLLLSFHSWHQLVWSLLVLFFWPLCWYSLTRFHNWGIFRTYPKFLCISVIVLYCCTPVRVLSMVISSDFEAAVTPFFLKFERENTWFAFIISSSSFVHTWKLYIEAHLYQAYKHCVIWVLSSQDMECDEAQLSPSANLKKPPPCNLICLW